VFFCCCFLFVCLSHEGCGLLRKKMKHYLLCQNRSIGAECSYITYAIFIFHFHKSMYRYTDLVFIHIGLCATLLHVLNQLCLSKMHVIIMNHQWAT
jgi:hypothetical protein